MKRPDSSVVEHLTRNQKACGSNSGRSKIYTALSLDSPSFEITVAVNKRRKALKHPPTLS